jgi:hypothetical protein
MKHTAFILAALLFTTLIGCTTVSPRTSYSPNLSDGKQFYDSKRYYEAIPRLQIAASQPENTAVRQEARFLLGMSYYHIDGFKDAIQMLSNYLKDAPNGAHVEDTRIHLADLQAKYDELYPSKATLEKRIQALEKEAPLSSADQFLMADLVWKTGRYEQAGMLYQKLVQDSSDYKYKSPLSERIEWKPDGTFTLLTPGEISRRDVAQNPIHITNTSSFRSGRDRRTGVHRFFVVTGQAINRSPQVQDGVVVDINVYGFGTQIYDTRRHSIGRMHPGETRTFSIRFSNFESLNNIDRFECKVAFQ